ncbi:MAG: SDR family NAD(P)-dependent oxidoreductase [Deltaproteobacteria bacterium]|nr:SDR family NAD(P)-dependent oxidoreductase [Deltaproteobacteria bacterium]
MEKKISKAVLITGCSSGIGRATAKHLMEEGYVVYATARDVETIEGLREQGARTLRLDVTDEASMAAAVAAIVEAEGAVGILVNNAGYAQGGAVETVPLEKIRRQFETNVFGLIRLTQLVLPGMRRQRWGRVINLSSMGGRLTLPGGGIYHASKHAVEAIGDALRFEVAGFGIKVVTIEPGLIRSGFAKAAVATLGGSEATSGPYGEFNETVARMTEEAYDRGAFARLGGEPEAVARVIAKALRNPRPRARYRVTNSARLLLLQRRLFGDRTWDAFLRTQYPEPSCPPPRPGVAAAESC